MFISLQELQLRAVGFRVDVPAGEIDFDSGISQNSVLHSEGVATLLSQSFGEIRIDGKLSVSMDGSCDRCLGSAAFSIDKEFDLVYIPSDQSAGEAEAIDRAAIEVGYYEGNGLNLDDVLREVVLLALPMRLVCSETCKGICPVCGQDRNLRDCHCQSESADERWSKLRALRPEFGSQP
ncbi:MAG: YceD family protein [Bryobacteraceae bacterium]